MIFEFEKINSPPDNIINPPDFKLIILEIVILKNFNICIFVVIIELSAKVRLLFIKLSDIIKLSIFNR